MFADFVGREIVHIGFSGLDQLYGKLVKLLEIIRGVQLFLAPIKTQPVDVFHDAVHVLGFFFHRVGIVEAQVARAPEGRGGFEVDRDGLDVPDVQVAVGLGREARAHVAKPPAAQVFRHGFADEIGGDVRGFVGHVSHPIFDVSGCFIEAKPR